MAARRLQWVAVEEIGEKRDGRGGRKGGGQGSGNVEGRSLEWWPVAARMVSGEGLGKMESGGGSWRRRSGGGKPVVK